MDKLNSFKLMNEHSEVGGVCAGLAYAFKLKTWYIRVAMLLLIFGLGLGFWLYIAIWIFAPKYDQDPKDYSTICE